MSVGGGGFGSGKTVALVIKLLRVAKQHPGIPILLGRKHLPMLKLTTIRELEKWMPRSWVRSHNKADASWELTNGSTITCRPLADHRELQGLNVGASFIDEAAEISELAWDTISDRTRVEGFPCSVNAVTNPEGRAHWLYKRGVVPALKGREGHFYCQASSLENLSTSERFRRSIMERYAGDDLARAVFGEWGNASGRVWGNFGPHNVVRLEDVDWTQPFEYERAIDFGYEHDFVCLWIAWAKAWVGHEQADVALVYREYADKRQSMRTHAEAIYRLEEEDRQRGVMRYGETWLEWDNQDRHELEHLENPLLRIKGRRAVKDRVPGHRSVQAGFLPDRLLGGMSRLYLADSCPRTIEQVESYARPEGAKREDQVVEFIGGESVVDHCDALRYAYHSRVRDDFRPERGYDPGAGELERSQLY